MPGNDANAMDNSLVRRVTALEDRAAIETLKARYMEAVDRCVEAPSAGTAAAVADLFTEDASANFAQFGSYEGRAQIAQFFQAVLPGVTSWTRHNATNPIIEVDGGGATGRWYAIVYGVFKDNPSAGPQTLWVRYEDTYAKTEQGWKMRALVVHFDSPAPPA